MYIIHNNPYSGHYEANGKVLYYMSVAKSCRKDSKKSLECLKSLE